MAKSRRKTSTRNHPIKDKKCQLCINSKKLYTSSSLGRHLKTVHGPGWKCPFCSINYSDKNSHRICFHKEKYLLNSFISKFIYGQTNNFINSSSANLSYLFEEKKHSFYCPKLMLGQGHFSQVFYAIDKENKKEIALKKFRYPNKAVNYKDEIKILKCLANKDFFPKVYSYDDEYSIDYMEITLMGPSLFDLYKFNNGPFDKKTILNLFYCLIKQLEYLSNRQIIHHDIKPENICLGVIENSRLKNQNNLYLIDYGLSFRKDDGSTNDEKSKRNWHCGTTIYMSINTHLKKKPEYFDDIETLIYTLMKLSEIGLPWENIKTCNFHYEKTILKMKQNLEIISYCGEMYEFISKIYIYLDKVKNGENRLDYNVIKEILRSEKKKMELPFNDYDSMFCFIDLMKLKLSEFMKTDRKTPEDEKLLKLFKAYPIDYAELYKSLLGK